MLGISISTNAEYNFEVPPGLLEKIQLLETIRSVCRECALLTTTTEPQAITYFP